ncbi:MAG: hypothetical protein QM736_11450 [Vicinamibacterales bacterium]
MHDEAGQTLIAAAFLLHSLGGNPETPAQIRQQLEQVVESIRTACNSLQTNVVERSGLPLAVELLVERFRRESPAVPIRLHVQEEWRFPSPDTYAVYRVIELALENVQRHAAATEVTVFLRCCNEGLSAGIHDNGRGFDPSAVFRSPPGAGLVLMGLYAEKASLQLHIESAPSQGTIIRVQTI